MFTIYKKEMEWGGRPLTIETGHVARQADGAVMVTYGGTVVLATVCYQKQSNPALDFFPLTVNYQEKYYATGRIPGGFFKREARPTEKETLVCRLIDRPIRPLFPKQFKNETQVLCNVLSADGENEADIVSLIATSAALTLSGAPFMGPIGAARVGYIGGKFVLNPTTEQRGESELDLVVAGTKEGVLMVESQAAELPESTMLDAVTFGHDEGKKVIDAIIELAEAAAKPGFELPEVEDTSDLEKKLEGFRKDIEKAYGIKEKQDRVAALAEIKEKALTKIAGAEEDRDEDIAKTLGGLFKSMESSVVRGSILAGNKRIDGRSTTDIRDIVAEVDLLPKTHGSALFTRGETQAIVVATLGTGRDEQLIDDINGEYKDNFMLHYNFPPFSVGEVGRAGFTSRREVGHGWLARRALTSMLPTKEDFPYTIRIVSEITESNGSSSMATVCGSSLAMMAAGVPLARPVAGIAMGLIKEDKDFEVLSDILGDEDHLGDMDFKVAGTEKGVTALQMDIKITSITKAIMEKALEQANAGRMHILGKMSKALDVSRGEVSDNAPGMETFNIPVDKIRDVIGTGGKIIRGLMEETGCSIDIEDDGTVFVSAVDRPSVKECVKQIKGIIAEAEEGKEYTGEITRVVDFGAFVRVLPNQEGLVHVSEILDIRVENVHDILKEGEEVNVKCIGFDRGKVRLTMKGIDQTGDVAKRMEEVLEAGGTSARPQNTDNKGGRGGKGGRRRAS
jgi:polyribonucleotide nucleotidyltransferase